MTKTNQDSIVSVTSEQIKYANLIFIEHDKLLVENSLLNQEINILNSINSDLERINSIRVQQLVEYDRLQQVQSDKIDSLNKDLRRVKTSNTYWRIGCFTVSAGLILLLLLK